MQLHLGPCAPSCPPHTPTPHTHPSPPNTRSTFYDRLKEVRAYHRRFPSEDITEGDGSEALLAAAEPAVAFSGEEALGRYLDLHELHAAHSNGAFAGQPLDYHTYVLALADWSRVARPARTSRAYREYLERLAAYLESFHARTQPLADLDAQMRGAVAEFEEAWARGAVPGWEDRGAGGAAAAGGRGEVPEGALDLDAFDSVDELELLGGQGLGVGDAGKGGTRSSVMDHLAPTSRRPEEPALPTNPCHPPAAHLPPISAPAPTRTPHTCTQSLTPPPRRPGAHQAGPARAAPEVRRHAPPARGAPLLHAGQDPRSAGPGPVRQGRRARRGAEPGPARAGRGSRARRGPAGGPRLPPAAPAGHGARRHRGSGGEAPGADLRGAAGGAGRGRGGECLEGVRGPWGSTRLCTARETGIGEERWEDEEPAQGDEYVLVMGGWL